MTTVTHRKLRERLRGGADWENTTGTYRCITLAGGVVNVDEMDLPAAEVHGCSIRHLDIAARRWTIYWTTSRTGVLLPPVHGGFRGGRGEFYGVDVENGTPRSRPLRLVELRDAAPPLGTSLFRGRRRHLGDQLDDRVRTLMAPHGNLECLPLGRYADLRRSLGTHAIDSL